MSCRVSNALLSCCALVLLAGPAQGADVLASFSQGTPDLQSAGALAFGPQGVLFVGDSKGAAVFAIDTSDTSGNPETVRLDVKEVDQMVASALGASRENAIINDLAVNPLSGNAYLSVTRGQGAQSTPVLLRLDRDAQLSEVSLKNVRYSKAALPNAPAEGGEGRRNRRQYAITDLLFVEGQLLVAGLSSEEFASKLRAIPFPFTGVDGGTSVEIYHGSHGQLEMRSPVRTFAAYSIGDVPHLLAAYTCTPLVKFPMEKLRPGVKITGETIAELGNRNSPLDMVIYSHSGRDFVLMANDRRGVMKIDLSSIDDADAITSRVSDAAGLPYETLDSLQGVVQLDRLNSGHVLLAMQTDEGSMSLKTVALP